MGRLIDADALFSEMKEYGAFAVKYSVGMSKDRIAESIVTQMRQQALQMVKDAPTVEAIPVVHGEWERISNRPKTYIRRCSVCSRESYTCFSSRDYNFCPWCGARMDGKEKE